MVKRSSHAPAADTPVADGMDRGEPAGRAAPAHGSIATRVIPARNANARAFDHWVTSMARRPRVCSRRP